MPRFSGSDAARSSAAVLGVLPFGHLPVSRDAIAFRGSASRRAWGARWVEGFSHLLQRMRATSVLALGDAFGPPGNAGAQGMSALVLQRLSQLNARLRIDNRCDDSAGGFAAALAAASKKPLIRHDALILFVTVKPWLPADEAAALQTLAAQALEASALVARRCFVVGAIDEHAALPPASAASERVPSADLLEALCERAGACWLALEEEEEDASLPGCAMPAENFSVDGFHPTSDSPAMWTAKLLERPELAELVFS